MNCSWRKFIDCLLLGLAWVSLVLLCNVFWWLFYGLILVFMMMVDAGIEMMKGYL